MLAIRDVCKFRKLNRFYIPDTAQWTKSTANQDTERNPPSRRRKKKLHSRRIAYSEGTVIKKKNPD